MARAAQYNESYKNLSKLYHVADFLEYKLAEYLVEIESTSNVNNELVFAVDSNFNKDLAVQYESPIEENNIFAYASIFSEDIRSLADSINESGLTEFKIRDSDKSMTMDKNIVETVHNLCKTESISQLVKWLNLTNVTKPQNEVLSSLDSLSRFVESCNTLSRGVPLSSDYTRTLDDVLSSGIEYVISGNIDRMLIDNPVAIRNDPESVHSILVSDNSSDIVIARSPEEESFYLIGNEALSVAVKSNESSRDLFYQDRATSKQISLEM